ncbi:MAG TPA: four helix bundle protein [Chitinophagales bacterium]|nr:four helix bundle protein [Chitinophagales bacterium]HMX04339.1 four helix bundle protein [Chitinophagales bacterium]HMZ90185.1 four helix bundle protein [Chitinophagales bacterium]HNF69411.1 four helix bundle protein [Chitinophagales bacterium]HNI53663.1 four helix bundle protein [Chitinophagales bacterium]
MHNYKSLIVWQNAMELVKEVYLTTKTFPKEEIYGLVQQIRRSAISIPSNITEGCGRKSDKDFDNFLSIAHASSFELETQLMIAESLSLIKNEESQLLLSKTSLVQKKLFKLKESLKLKNN